MNIQFQKAKSSTTVITSTRVMAIIAAAQARFIILTIVLSGVPDYGYELILINT